MQAYGLRQWLLQQGVQAEFINYHPSHVEAGGLSFNRGAKAFAKSAFLLAMQVKRRLSGDKQQAEAFGRFQAGVLGVTGPVLRGPGDLAGLSAFDLIVCGSDQIWNPSEQHGLDPVYFASFPGAERARRISYAASFGKSSLAEAYQAQAAGLISALDAVAVREQSGVEIVRAITDREAVMTPDPTILLGNFKPLIESHPTGRQGHVFCYTLRTPEGVREAATVAAEITGGEILSPDNPHRRWREIGTTVHPSPGEWVSLIDSASVVVTNSFHGVALSLLLQKPFVSIALPGARASLSERAKNLLAQVGLEDRLVAAGDIEAVRAAISRPIAWESVAAKLEAMRSTGAGYLDAQLGAVRKLAA